MMPRIEGCGDGPEAIIGCGYILDIVAKNMVCWLGTDGCTEDLRDWSLAREA